MLKLNYKKILVFMILLLLIGIFAYFCFPRPKSFNVIISRAEPKILQQAALALEQEMEDVPLKNPTDFYIANFNDTTIPDIRHKDHTNVIWLGSRKNFDMTKLKNFDYIMASTSDLGAYLTQANFSHAVHPLFVDNQSADASPAKCVLNPHREGCYFVVVGHQPVVLSTLRRYKLAYKSYAQITEPLSDILSEDIRHISGIISNHTRFAEQSLDVVPFFLEAINRQIPILIPNLYLNSSEDVLQNGLLLTLLFADTLNYYTYESDIEDFLNCLPCRLTNAKKAKYLLTHLFSVTALKKHLLSMFENNAYEPHIKDTLTIVSPTYIGLYNNGDYWIAKDLEEAFVPLYQEALTVFPISRISYIGDTYLYIRGGLPLVESKILPHTVSLYYLLFPLFADESNITSLDDFIQNILPELKNVDAVAVASKTVAQALQEKGIRAYYIPQFTNTKKFYPDYDEDKKSEVLFVGNYLAYRTAVPAVSKAGLPLTVYGNNWPEGVAKAPYVDNRILRQYYSSAKIVLNDTREGMKKFGFIINRIFDATACETLVISDYMKEVEEIYGDTVPMWKTEEELVALVKYYLAPENEAERKDKARRAREITLKHFTAEIAVQKFDTIIRQIKQEKGI